MPTMMPRKLQMKLFFISLTTSVSNRWDSTKQIHFSWALVRRWRARESQSTPSMSNTPPANFTLHILLCKLWLIFATHTHHCFFTFMENQNQKQQKTIQQVKLGPAPCSWLFNCSRTHLTGDCEYTQWRALVVEQDCPSLQYLRWPWKQNLGSKWQRWNRESNQFKIVVFFSYSVT